MKDKISSSTFYTHSSLLSQLQFASLAGELKQSIPPLSSSSIWCAFYISGGWGTSSGLPIVMIFRLFTKYFWFSFQAHDRISLPYPLEVTGGFLHPGTRSRSDVCHLWTDTLRSSVLTHHISFSCGGDCGLSCQDGSLNDYKDSAVNVYRTHTWSVK